MSSFDLEVTILVKGVEIRLDPMTLRWSTIDPDDDRALTLASLANLTTTMLGSPGPSDGDPLVWIATRVAAKLEGEASWDPPPPPEEGVVY